MNPRAIFFGFVLSAPLWALIYIAIDVIPDLDIVGGLILCLTAVALLAWGLRKELA